MRTDYRQELALLQDPLARTAALAGVVVCFLLVPLASSDYLLSGLLIPFLVFSLAALGLNLLMGYAGQVSFGTAGFMAIGAFATYNLILRQDWLPNSAAFILGALCAAVVGVLFGLPSLRVRGFYLAAATLATQFLTLWCLTKFGWLSNYNASGIITAQIVSPLGFELTTPLRKYLFVLITVSLMTLIAVNLVRTNTGRKWIAIRDMDVAAEIIGIVPLWAKLSAFAVSSFYCGMAGALYAFAYVGTVEPEAFGLELSFKIMFMIIIGGLGSISGAFFGAAFIFLVPVILAHTFGLVELFTGLQLPANMTSLAEIVVFGALIIVFLVREPHGISNIWHGFVARLKTWPLTC